MAALTIRNLDDDTKLALRLQAARHGVSMEQEARTLLRDALSPSKRGRVEGDQPGKGFFDSVRELVEPHGGFDDFAVPPRNQTMREPPSFD